MKSMTKPMYEYEQFFTEKGKQRICGIDEAGRGPLAGPVCAAAVILDPSRPIEGLNDSKKLSEKKRELLFDEICEKAAFWGVGWASHTEIDEINILQATFLAMRRAVEGLKTTPDIAIVDGNRDPQLGCETLCIIKGDGKSASIAAASILAKVSRDRLMVAEAARYPAYGFEIHKGYPTKAHRQAVLEYGPCEIHRRSFLKKLLGETGE